MTDQSVNSDTQSTRTRPTEPFCPCCGAPNQDDSVFDEPDSGQLQAFACRVSDLLWGGELGWTHGKDGLDRLFEAVKALKARADS